MVTVIRSTIALSRSNALWRTFWLVPICTFSPAKADLPPVTCLPDEIVVTIDFDLFRIESCAIAEYNLPPDNYDPPSVPDDEFWSRTLPWDGGTEPFVPESNQERGEGDAEDNHGSCKGGNPVSISTGNKYHSETDFVGSGRLPLTIQRYYNSLQASAPAYKGAFGQGWSSNLTERILAIETSDPNNRQVLIENSSGYRFRLTSTNGNPWLMPNGKEVLFEFDDDTETWIWWENGIRKTFLTDGEIYQIRHSSGEYITFDYSTHETFSDGSLRPSKILHSSGRELDVTWDNDDRISQINDPAGLTYTYTYDASGNLIRVDYPIPDAETGSITYKYELSTAPNTSALTAIVYSRWQRRVC